MRALPALFAASMIGMAAPAIAQPAGAPPEVTVNIGPALAERAPVLGTRALNDLRASLAHEVRRATARSGDIARVDLVIDAATPNRPTDTQLSHNLQLSAQSIGVGGARISGVVTEASGARRPVRYQYYAGDIREEQAGTRWFDADRAFTTLSARIARGDVPDAFTGPGPISGEGAFGDYP